MTTEAPAPRFLHIERPQGHVWHPVRDAAHLLVLIDRLTLVVPHDATWEVTTTDTSPPPEEPTA